MATCIWLALSFVLPASTRAELPFVDPPRWTARTTFGPGVMLSPDQTGRMHYDRIAMLGNLQGAYTLVPWLEVQAGVQMGAFLASGHERTGGLMAFSAGPRVQLPSRGLRPWLSLDVGPALTGKEARPHLGITAGFDARASSRLSVGPAFSFGRLFARNVPLASSDATYLWVGVTMRYRFDDPPLPPPPPPPPPPRIIVRRTPAPPAPPPEHDVTEVLKLIESAVPTVTQRTELLAPVLFRFDSDELEPIGVAMLHEVAHTLATRPDIPMLEIQGYADQRGSAEYNQALSQRRAERVQRWLIEHGVAPERLRVAARGASAPVEAGAEERAHTQNRRVIFRVVEQGGTP